jgi:hypothetical protein
MNKTESYCRIRAIAFDKNPKYYLCSLNYFLFLAVIISHKTQVYARESKKKQINSEKNKKKRIRRKEKPKIDVIAQSQI